MLRIDPATLHAQELLPGVRQRVFGGKGRSTSRTVLQMPEQPANVVHFFSCNVNFPGQRNTIFVCMHAVLYQIDEFVSPCSEPDSDSGTVSEA